MTKNYHGYLVTPEGVVYSRKPGCDHPLAQSISDRGYPRVYLQINGKKKVMKIHRLVAELFVPNPDNKREVNHKDGNKRNNNADNLEWCTRSENLKHAYRTGLRKSRKGVPRKTATK